MKIVKGFLNMIALLIASVHATGKPLHQAVNYLPAGTTETNVSRNNLPAAVPITVSNNTGNITGRDSTENLIDNRYKAAMERLKLQAASLKAYAKANNYNAEFCFLVDMSIPSGKKRFFVYNLKADSVESASLVSHGFGSYKENCEDQLVFSNMPYSFKTSLGRYKIGSAYTGTYGLAYKLYGLDSTNNRAYERAIVLHSDKNIPETETYPHRIFQSAGCPAVAPSFLPVIGNYVKASKKPMLMWIYS